jgi:hypothetical protein
MIIKVRSRLLLLLLDFLRPFGKLAGRGGGDENSQTSTTTTTTATSVIVSRL